MKHTSILSAVCALFTGFAAYPQSHISKQPHQKPVSAVIATAGNDFFSAGNDGFLIKWTDDGLGEHYQISDLGISMIACSPNGKELAVYETDGGTINRVSVWNWSNLTRKYALRFENPLTSLAYSEKGSYLMAGTASMTGLLFLNASNGRVVNKLKENTGVISLAATSATEKSAVMYAQNGSLVYYNLQTGRHEHKFDTTASLRQPVLFHNNLMLAGINGSTLYVIQATSGIPAAKIAVKNAVIVSAKADADLYYLNYDGRNYALTKIPVQQGGAVLQPVVIRTFSLLSKRQNITSAVKAGNRILMGSEDGALYALDIPDEGMESTASVTLLTDTMYDRILDVERFGEDFYFLTASMLFKSSYTDGNVEKITDNHGHTNIIPYGDKIIFWSKNDKKPVQEYSVSDGTITPLFTPDNAIKSMRIFGSTLLVLEGNTSVSSISLEESAGKSSGRKKKLLYTGSGLEDMVLYNDTELYVSKSAATRPESALIHINTQTQETVPVQFSGAVAFSLTYDTTHDSSNIYGIAVTSNANGTGASGSTMLFAFNPETKFTYHLLQINEEDSNAFITMSYPNLYTNLGKTQIRSYDTYTRKNFIYKRSAALPLKAVRSGNQLVVLNRDGSISWYNSSNAAVAADWYFTNQQQWTEF